MTAAPREKFTCAVCGGIFIKGHTDEVAMVEARAHFSAEELKGNLMVVCSSCAKELYAWLKKKKGK